MSPGTEEQDISGDWKLLQATIGGNTSSGSLSSKQVTAAEAGVVLLLGKGTLSRVFFWTTRALWCCCAPIPPPLQRYFFVFFWRGTSDVPQTLLLVHAGGPFR